MLLRYHHELSLRTEAMAKNIAHIPNITLIGIAVTWNIKWSRKIF
jgi:hypothetical protein